MCGITGYFNSGQRFISEKELRCATDSISHRGPDDSGYFIGDHVGLGHRRLSILDLSSLGHQPMHSSTGRYVMAFNGEIYNYLALKEELATKGYHFKSHSDTEVVVNGYEYWNNNLFEKLNGIFAISIWDKEEKKLTLARDRMGVKPLYYWCNGNLLLFGSEIKSILSYGIVERKISKQSLHEFIYYGYALGENTLFTGIKKVLPGNYIEINSDNVAVKSFWSHQKVKTYAMREVNESAMISKTKTLLFSAIERQLMSDVPVGVFLSGGIDSSAITAIASEQYNGKLKTYSAGFDFDGGHNELPLAAKIAKKFGTEHQELFIKGRDLPSIIEKLVFHHDEPFSDAANIPLYLMTEKVKHDCKVILQGDGGDELFAGYPRYHIMSKYNRYKFIFTILNICKNLIPSKYIYNKIERFYPLFKEGKNEVSIVKFLRDERVGNPETLFAKSIQESFSNTRPFERYELISKEFDFLADNVQKLLWVDTKIILPDQFLEKVDKSTMANSVEVRVPFLDNELVNFALGLPSELKVKNGIKKYVLKKALAGIVPNEVLYGPKKGFGVPYRNWIKGPLKSYVCEVFNDSYVRNLGIIDYHKLNLIFEEHGSDKRDWGFLLWKMMNLFIWIKMYNIEFDE